MQILNISKNRFEKFEPLDLPDGIFNTEAKMYIIPGKNKWSKKQTVLKRLYHDSGEVFSNKLYTVNELLDKKDTIGIEELVMPEALAAVNSEIVGFTMPYIPNVNLQQLLNDDKLPLETKVSYLKEIGELLEKISKVRQYTSVKDFYLNDVHENNFILNTDTGRINAVDIDSAKIGNNQATGARYLSPMSPIYMIPKYKKLEHSVGGVFEVTEDTEIYCYIVMILNFFYGSNITRLPVQDFYVYLDYLSKIGVSKEILDMFSYIYTGHANKNPYEYLEDLQRFYGRTHKNTFERVRAKTF